MTRSGSVLPDQVHRLVPPAGLAHHVVTLVLEDLLQVEPDDGLILGDDHAPGHWDRSSGLGRSEPRAPRPDARRDAPTPPMAECR